MDVILWLTFALVIVLWCLVGVAIWWGLKLRGLFVQLAPMMGAMSAMAPPLPPWQYGGRADPAAPLPPRQ